MIIISHEEDVKIIKLNQDSVVHDRNAILTAIDSENPPVILSISFTGPTGELKTYGDVKIIPKEESENNCYDASVVSYYKGSILPEALKLSLKELFSWINKNKIRPEIIYVKDSECQISKLEFINLTLIIQNIMKDYKINSSLWMETIEKDDISTLSMSTEKSDKDKKDKKKKKKNKKKNK